MTALYTAAVAVFEQAIRDWPIPEVALKSGKVSPELLAAVRDLGNVLGECGFDLDQAVPGEDEDAPNTIECPRCGAVQSDFDGFGFMFCEVCRLCTHSSQDGDGKGNWVCGLCGRITSKASKT